MEENGYNGEEWHVYCNVQEIAYNKINLKFTGFGESLFSPILSF